MAEYEKNIVEITDDGSCTLFNKNSGEHYHSHFGAISESNHIFINAGLDYYFSKNKGVKEMHILEVGFGTGLNALLALLYCKKFNFKIFYTAYEPFPIDISLIGKLNYTNILGIDNDLLISLHNRDNYICDYYSIDIRKELFEKSELNSSQFDVVFFDAFSPQAQPELWTKEVMLMIYNSMTEGGVLTTYSCKGIVKRALKESGFTIEKLPGPPGKREFLRAHKLLL